MEFNFKYLWTFISYRTQNKVENANEKESACFLSFKPAASREMHDNLQ